MTVTVAPATPKTPKTISPQAWLFSLLGIVVLTFGLNLLIAWHFDIFGLLRDAHGRQLANSRHERQAKYLLNFKYVPENFDALVIGSSGSANWRLDGLSQYHFYNESMLGADASEERKLVDKALENGGQFKVAIINVNQQLTSRHDLQDGLDQADPKEVLGSIYSYTMLLDRAHDYLLHRPSDFYPDGSWQFPQHKLIPPGPDFRAKKLDVDPKALEDYRALVQELVNRGTKIVYVLAPHYGVDQDGSRQIMAGYNPYFFSVMPPGPIIDFNEPQYAELRANQDLMIDDDHLSLAGVPVYSRLVIQRLHQALHDQ